MFICLISILIMKTSAYISLLSKEIQQNNNVVKDIIRYQFDNENQSVGQNLQIKTQKKDFGHYLENTPRKDQEEADFLNNENSLLVKNKPKTGNWTNSFVFCSTSTEGRNLNNMTQKLQSKDLRIPDVVEFENSGNNPSDNSSKRLKNIHKRYLAGNSHLNLIPVQFMKNVSQNQSIASKNLLKIYGLSKNKHRNTKKKKKDKYKLLKDIIFLNDNQ